MSLLPEAGRLDWGLGNPNKTATLIALLMIGSWAWLYLRRFGFWIALFQCLFLSYFLVLTRSRGGLVAALVGLGILAYFARRPWDKRFVAAAALSLAAFGGLSVWEGASQRYTQQFVRADPSIAHRLLIWKKVPQMIVDAPEGWGRGNSGTAYMQWYQQVERPETYRTLVSSHLTWLVEFGWPCRILYLWGWAAIFLLSYPARGDFPWGAINFAMWAAFFIAACFSSIAECPQLWILPLASIILAAALRIRHGNLPLPPLWKPTILIMAVVAAGVCLLPWMPRLRSPISYRNNLVTAGNPDGAACLVDPDTTIVGQQYGHDVRRALQAGRLQGFIVATEYSSGLQGRTLVYTGSTVPRFSVLSGQSRVVLLNPSWIPAPGNQEGLKKGSLKVFCGEFCSHANADAWRDFSEVNPNVEFHLVEGCESFLPNWLGFIEAPNE